MNTTMTLSEELTWRGFIHQTTVKDLQELDAKKPITFYHGFDASAKSQTVGNLAAMMADLVFLRHGHKAIILAGGATSLIGDPGGKDKERPMQTSDTIAANIAGATVQIKKIYGEFPITIVNNLDWTKDMTVIDFLRDIGKYFNVSEMIKKEYIAERIGGTGISYTEFSYALLQGYDYLHLYEKFGCTLQLGGSDQWTNCLAGVELIRKKLSKQVEVLTLPLVINKATGKKFGKSEAGAVWLDPTLTTPYDFYQFWLNTDDEGVQDYLKVYTSIQKPEYDALINEFNIDRSKRAAQKYLAYAVTTLVHGENEAKKALEASAALFSGTSVQIDSLPLYSAKEYYTDGALQLVEFLVGSGIISSKREARTLIDSKGIYIDDETVNGYEVQFPENKEVLLRVGKKRYFRLVC